MIVKILVWLLGSIISLIMFHWVFVPILRKQEIWTKGEAELLAMCYFVTSWVGLLAQVLLIRMHKNNKPL